MIQVVCVSGLAFFLNEKRVIRRPRPKLTTRRYIADLLGHPIRRKFAGLYFSISMLMNLAVFGGFLRLFATHNLGATQAQFGETFSVSTLPPLFLSIPVALLVERYLSKRIALVIGIGTIIAAFMVGWAAQSLDGLFWLALLWGFGYMLTYATFKAFFSEYVPSDIIGQVTGALNICWGLGRSLAILIAGFAVDHLFDDDYRFIFPLSIAMGVVSLVLALSIPDLRFESKKRKKNNRTV